MDDFRELKPTDVMIIGGGLAGLRAGIEASKRGASVRIVSKEKCEGATSSVLSHGYITRCPEEAKDKLFEEMLWAGGGLNDQYLLRAFIDDVTSRVEELKEWGVELVVVDENPPELPGLYRVVPQRGKLAGYPLVKRLREICIDRGVEFVEEVAICSLLKGEEGIIGALGVDLKKQRVFIVACQGGGSCHGRRVRAFSTTQQHERDDWRWFRSRLGSGRKPHQHRVHNF